MIAAGAPAEIAMPHRLRQSAKVQFGDYQANGVMVAVAKNPGMAPTTCREQVPTHLDPAASPARLKSPAPLYQYFPRTGFSR